MCCINGAKKISRRVEESMKVQPLQRDDFKMSFLHMPFLTMPFLHMWMMDLVSIHMLSSRQEKKMCQGVYWTRSTTSHSVNEAMKVQPLQKDYLKMGEAKSTMCKGIHGIKQTSH